METTGKIRPIEVLNTAPFIVVEIIGVPPEQIYYNLLAALIFPKCRVDNLYFVFCNHVLPEIQNQTGII